MLSPADSILAYIRAKDGNRPHLLDWAFTADAYLKIRVHTESISFPSESDGREAIANTLVRHFNQAYENIYTFCIGVPPRSAVETFACPWLVAMSERQNGAVRVGCGRYDWRFSGHRICALDITIDFMEVLPPHTLDVVMDWVSGLPYPWCSESAVARGAAEIPSLPHVVGCLNKYCQVEAG